MGSGMKSALGFDREGGDGYLGLCGRITGDGCDRLWRLPRAIHGQARLLRQPHFAGLARKDRLGVEERGVEWRYC